MANKRMTCRLAFWQDPKTGKMRRLKYHACDATCAMTQRECMDVMRTQGFWVAGWQGEPGQRIVSVLDPNADRAPRIATFRGRGLYGSLANLS